MNTTTATDAPFEIVPAEDGAHLAHSAACPTCSVSGETGRSCPEGMRLWTAAHTVRHDVAAAPITTVNRYGHTKGHWSALSALAEVGINGGEITKAPAGMIEAGKAEQERELREARERRAAHRAAGTRTPRRRF